MSVPPPIPVARSTFVNVVAWIFIGLSGFMTFMMLLESLLLPRLFMPMLQQLKLQPMPPELSPYMSWYFDHLIELCYLTLLLSSMHLLAAIGLLKRKDWARRLFIGLLGLDMIYQLFGAALQWWLVGPMQHAMLQVQFATMQQQMPAEQRAQALQMQAQLMSMMDSMMLAGRIFSVLVAAAFIVLFAWIIKRLCSATIRREFVPASSTH